MEYNFAEIEAKWQEYWSKNKTFKTENKSDKPKFYILDMFPYPSGAGLHVGHPLGYIASDIYSRYMRLNGYNVLHPMGYDSFGLPAEQYAIQTGQHPAITTETNIKRYREQLDKIGFSFDWDREVRTSDPSYYKWTQWIFKQLFNSWYNKANDKAEKIETLIAEFERAGNKEVDAVCAETSTFTAEKWKNYSEKQQQEILLNYRLAYLSDVMVNWCPGLGTVLANEEVINGVSERGGYPVERKLMRQWSMRITAYAERLLQGLDKIDWSDALKEMQRNWIGKSRGAEVDFSLSPNPSPKERGMEVHSDTSEIQERSTTLGYHTASPEKYKALIEKALEMRQNPTEGEKLMWELLRRDASGYHFRRQHVIDRFIADFVCLGKQLIIEVDGDIHDLQKEEDEGRTHELEKWGYTVLRFRNEEIIYNPSDVLSKVRQVLSSLPDVKDVPHTDLPPSPSKGGGAGMHSDTSPAQVAGKSNSPLLGRGAGGEVNTETSIKVFTTRPDTIFGVTFMVLAPEHELVEKITTPERKEEVMAYAEEAKNRSERERMTEVKRVSGAFTGAYVAHPFTGEDIPVWVSDYVLAGYGTGAIMAVPSGDQRDWNFARHFGLPIVPVIDGSNVDVEANETKEGILINSDFLNGLQVPDAIKLAIEKIEGKGIGLGKTNYRLRDAIFSRQRYWGEPFPVYYKDGVPYMLEDNELPVTLPEVDKYLPTETGEPPLARAENWTTKEGYQPDYNTMPGWAGSSWYYLRYMDAHNDNEFVSKEAVDYWGQVDIYFGGAEHATGHLLYVRFWTMFFKDMGYVNFDEPAKKLINQGMIQGVSEKMYRFEDRLHVYGAYLPPQRNIHITLDKPREIYITASNKTNWEKAREENRKQGITSNPTVDEKGIAVPIEFVNDNKLDLARLLKARPQLNDSLFITEEGIWLDGKLCPYEELKSEFQYLDLQKFKPTKDEVTFTTFSEVEKMSKSKWNVVNPDDIIDQYGTDTLRMYEMFLGPLEQAKPWDTKGIEGVYRFLRKFWKLYHNLPPSPSLGGGAGMHSDAVENKKGNEDNALNSPLPGRGARGEAFVTDDEPTKAELKVLHKTIKKIQDDIERMSFNTGVSAFMICMNELADLNCNKRAILEPLCVLISPFAPHIAEELWQQLGHTESITFAKFPEFKKEYLVEDSFSYPISFNGKTRFNMELPLNIDKAEVERMVIEAEQVKKYLEGKAPKKVIVVPNRIVNIVV